MANETIKLTGGNIHLTEQKNTAFRVEDGQVLVYLIPLRNGKLGRRHFIYEASCGEVLPAFCIEAPYGLDDPEVCSWCFGFVAVDNATLSASDIDNATALQTINTDFAHRASLRQVAELGFEEAVLETYRLNLARELRNIYKTGEEQESSRLGSLRVIEHFFHKNGRATIDHLEENIPLYDTVAFLCGYMDVPVASIEDIRTSCGRKFSVKDIARLSHFVCRDIVLSENWYRENAGPILAFTAKDKSPIACYPKGPNKYMAYNPADGTKRMVDAALASTLSPQAQMLYRPFPNKALSFWDMIKFGFKDVYKRDVVAILALAFIGTLIGLLIPYINENIYDQFIPMGDSSALVQVCMVVLACTVGNISFTLVKNLFNFRSMSTMKYSLQSAVYDRLFNLPESFFRKYDSADLVQRSMGITSMFQSVSDLLVRVGLTAVFSLFYLWRMFDYSDTMSWWAIAMLVISTALIFWLGYRQIRYEKEKLELDGKIQSFMFQLLGGISKIRIAGVEDRMLYEYLKPYTKSRKLQERKEKYTIVATAISGILSTVFSMIFYYLIIHEEIELSMGAFMGFSTAFGSFSGAMLELVKSTLQINAVIPVYDRIKPILETPSEIEEDTVMPGELSGEIEISHVTFAYDKESNPVLEDLSLHIKPGEYIGVVGSSGCGKSTLLKLLLGFEKPQSGKIYYDGCDVEAMDKRELRKKFGVVLQNGGLISGSISENITITAPGTTLARINEVLQEVGLADDVKSMPMGLHTLVSKGGGGLSGGQQQRILIARAIVGKPKIIFFDEATSALDNATQAMVTETLEGLNATKFVIAHRLSTVMHCDRILVMDAGKIVEQGDYESLMAQKGLFYRLASRQIS